MRLFLLAVTIFQVEIYKRTTVFKPFHQVYIYCRSDILVLVHIVDFNCLNPHLGFFFIFFGIRSSSLLLTSGVSNSNTEDKPKSEEVEFCLFSILFERLVSCLFANLFSKLVTCCFLVYFIHCSSMLSWSEMLPLFIVLL